MGRLNRGQQTQQTLCKHDCATPGQKTIADQPPKMLLSRVCTVFPGGLGQLGAQSQNDKGPDKRTSVTTCRRPPGSPVLHRLTFFPPSPSRSAPLPDAVRSLPPAPCRKKIRLIRRVVTLAFFAPPQLIVSRTLSGSSS